MTKAEREARLRAVRRMQDNVYDDIGTPQEMRPDIDGDDGPSRGDRARADARRMARSLTQGGVDDADLSGIDNPRIGRRNKAKLPIETGAEGATRRAVIGDPSRTKRGSAEDEERMLRRRR